MSKKVSLRIISDEAIINKILYIRGQKVMLDSDLAELHQVETKRLKEQVKRNITRFPQQYMFELTQKEFDILRSQIASSKQGRGGVRYLPMVFTEHGVLQLSNVLKSKRAVAVSFNIIDVFVKLRQMLTDNTKLRLLIEQVRKKTDNNTNNIELVFQYLDELLERKEKPKPYKAMGFQIPHKKKD